MPLPDFLRRASSYFLGYDYEDNEEPPDYVDNEILFCKNNVCVHPPTVARHELDIVHHPGYLTVTTKVFTDQHNNTKRPTLFLTWIPNTTLRKCPSAAETSPSDELGYGLIDVKSKDCYTKALSVDAANTQRRTIDARNENAFYDSSETTSLNSNSDKQSIRSSDTRYMGSDVTQDDLSSSSKPTVKSTLQGGDEYMCFDSKSDGSKDDMFVYDKHVRSQSMTSVNITIANPNIENVDLTPDSASGERFIRSLSMSSCDEGNPNWISTPEFLALKHNLAFPDSVHSSPAPQRRAPMVCRR
ncbi:TBC1 domain family member 16 [Eumeta japonica]|uniref:TBC1 domain family member 16 n=1 Tax=Eumeta variegata TaxID=151549 RepID=A0A4C1VHI4_EUMVA|nr:TBC1 domain family member 16 [Eumeta japonica]